MSLVSHTTGRISFSFLLLFLSLTVSGTLWGQRTERPEPDPEGTLNRLEELHRAGLEQKDEEEEDVDGRREWFYFQRSYPYPTVPAGIRAEAVRQTERFQRIINQSRDEKGARAFATNSWRNIGPFNIAGRLRAVVPHPAEQGRLFVGAAAGGVWTGLVSSPNWRTTFDKESALSIGAMAFNPRNPLVLYVGTGEVIANHTSVFNATPAYFGDGIIKSTDGGETWFSSGLTHVGTISGLYVRSDDTNVVYTSGAQGGGGFFRSTNAGRDWQQTLTDQVFGISVNPENEDEVLISLAGTVRRSTDGGKTFTGVSGFNVSGGIRTTIDRSRSNPNIVYALVASSVSFGEDAATVMKSTDGGQSWTSIKSFDSRFFRGQGHYNNAIGVHPTNPNVVIIAGIDAYVTNDGGATALSWQNTTRSYSGGDVHPDQHTIAFDPFDPDVVYLGNDGGLYMSADMGFSWQRVEAELPVTQYYAMDVDQTRPYRAYGGTQDNGSQGSFGVNDWTKEWESVSYFGGDGFQVLVDLADPNRLYAESQYGHLWRVDVTDGSRPSQSYRYLTADLDYESSESYDPGAWLTPIAQSPIDRRSLFTGRTKLWFSGNYGSSWIPFETGTQQKISAIGLSPFSAEKLIIGTISGEVSYTTNGGENWQRSAGLPNAYAADLMYDPVDPNRVYAVLSGSGQQHIFRSDNSGASFVDITNNLPAIPTSAIEIDPTNNQILFVGNDVGVFLSLDGGQLWLPFNDGLAYTPVVDLKIQRQSRQLIAATHGRSMFAVSIVNPQPEPALITPVGGVPQISPGELGISWAGFGEPVRVLISYDGGESFDTIYTNVADASVQYDLPFVRSNNAVVRVETLDGTKFVESSPFPISPNPNTIYRGPRGNTLAGALAVRKNDLWAADRNSESFIKLRLPLLLPLGSPVVRTGMVGSVIDMTWEPESDRFYVLTGNEIDYSNPHIYVMDTTGAKVAEFPAPAPNLSGISVAPEGIAVMTPGVDGKVIVMSASDGSVIRTTSEVPDGPGLARVSLEWDGFGLAQAVDGVRPGSTFPDALQRLDHSGQLGINADVPIVLREDSDIGFYGLAIYAPEGKSTVTYIFTDTAGGYYVMELEAGVTDVRTGESPNLATGVRIVEVSPNPFRDRGTIAIALDRAQDVTVEVFSAKGERVATTFAGRLEAGNRSVEIDARNFPSGIYYVVVSGEERQRDIAPAVILH